MSLFGSTNGETAWSRCIEEVDYETDAARDLAQDTLDEVERVRSKLSSLRSVARQYDGSDVLIRLAADLESAVQHDVTDLVNDLRRALKAAEHIGHMIDSLK